MKKTQTRSRRVHLCRKNFNSRYCISTMFKHTKAPINLKLRIRHPFGEVTNIMRDNTWRELASRLQMLQENGASHVEVY